MICRKILFPKLFILLLFPCFIYPQSIVRKINAIPAAIDFSEKLRIWDGFGFNYVELAHTYNYEEFRQEYGGFSLLDEDEKKTIVDLVFGDEGLKVSLVKMFLYVKAYTQVIRVSS